LLRAIIFDFDGVIVDSEPLIFQLTQQMAAQEGWTVSEDEYFRDYLALDDRGIIEHLFQSRGRPVDARRRDDLLAWKFRAYQEIISSGLPPMPGAVEFVKRAADRFPLAIASGSLRVEIEHLLSVLGLRECFSALVTADDCERSKPDPEAYLQAVARLRELPVFKEAPLQASECLAVEDAPLGVVAARKAGMKSLALTHSRPAEELQDADWLFREFAEIDLNGIAAEMS
jgi:HAD superfamily hydrolase (TIGR01509 family)